MYLAANLTMDAATSITHDADAKTHAKIQEASPRKPGRPPKKQKAERWQQQTQRARDFKSVGHAVERSQNECCICFNPLWSAADSVVGRLLRSGNGPPWQFCCSHVFCGACLSKSVERARTCPYCRESGVAWHHFRKSNGHIATGLIAHAQDEAEQRYVEQLRTSTGTSTGSGSVGSTSVAGEADSIWDPQEELRVLRRCRAFLRARETREANRQAEKRLKSTLYSRRVA